MKTKKKSKQDNFLPDSFVCNADGCDLKGRIACRKCYDIVYCSKKCGEMDHEKHKKICKPKVFPILVYQNGVPFIIEVFTTLNEAKLYRKSITKFKTFIKKSVIIDESVDKPKVVAKDMIYYKFDDSCNILTDKAYLNKTDLTKEGHNFMEYCVQDGGTIVGHCIKLGMKKKLINKKTADLQKKAQQDYNSREDERDKKKQNAKPKSNRQFYNWMKNRNGNYAKDPHINQMLTMMDKHIKNENKEEAIDILNAMMGKK